MEYITLYHRTGVLQGQVKVPYSKSESNRAQILQALSRGAITVGRLSNAIDTQKMKWVLASKDKIIDVEHAGTAMRFLTAYYCAIGRNTILTGSPRMCERPIGVLVEALRALGFQIEYLSEKGYPPLEIIPTKNAIGNRVEIAGNISSQYISALLMIAPTLPDGLRIDFTTALSSRPYILLTLDLMARAGIRYEMSDTHIHIAYQSFTPTTIVTQGDWSSASYWYAVAVLSKESKFRILRLNMETNQGDKIIATWMESMGIRTTSFSTTDTAISVYCDIVKTDATPAPLTAYDFTDYPDLAQTIIVLYAAKGWRARFTGLQSLRIKETDRIMALQQELLRCGVTLYESSTDVYELEGDFHLPTEAIDTYGDHRMAMSFGVLAVLGKVKIREDIVVYKSYPDFWSDMKLLGFQLKVHYV